MSILLDIHQCIDCSNHYRKVVGCIHPIPLLLGFRNTLLSPAQHEATRVNISIKHTAA